MIDVIYARQITDDDLRRVSLPRKAVRVSRPAFFTAGDLRELFECAWATSGVVLASELLALLDDGKAIGPTLRRRAAPLHPSGWGVYRVGTDRGLTVASPDIHRRHSDACAVARSMDPIGGHLVVAWTDRSALVAVIDLTVDYTVIVTPFGEKGMWRSRAGMWRLAVPGATGRQLGTSRARAAKTVGGLVGAGFEVIPLDDEPAPCTDYVKFTGLLDVYDVDDLPREVTA